MSETATSNPELEKAPVAARLAAAGGVLAAIVAAVAVWYFDPTTAKLFPVCPLFSLTGFACPGCGLTRGFHALFRGDVMQALDFNALIPIFGLFFGYLFLSMLRFSLWGKVLSLGKVNAPLLWIVLGLLLTFGIARNLSIYPFNILYP